MASRYKCPVCGSRDNVRIVYGMPDSGLFEAAEAGTVAIGGCIVSDDDPKRQCRVCDTRFWLDGRYVVDDEDEGSIAIPLVRSESPEISIYLDAQFRGNGDLVLAGQDVGSRVEEIFGDSDYEYWLTVCSADTGRVLALLLVERYPTLARLEERFKSWRLPVIVLSPDADQPFQVELSSESGELLITSDSGDQLAIVPGHSFRHLTLSVLKDCFADEVFTSDSEFRDWLTAHDIESEFASYV